MALEAVVFPQGLFGCTFKELLAIEGEEEEEQWRGWLDGVYGNWDPSCSSMVQNFEQWHVVGSSSLETCKKEDSFPAVVFGKETSAAVASRKKRRRTQSHKNKEELETQRMTHIAVERNRRKQMNEYLTVLRSLMPPSYVQRGDQASIIGGAINFVKELEQLLQSLEAQKCIKHQSSRGTTVPFAGFFSFPQYSSCSSQFSNPMAADPTEANSSNKSSTENLSILADIEVKMVESHASLKVLSRRRPKQLLKMVAALQNLHLTTFHLNVTTVDDMVLYSFSLKVEEECRLTSMGEIAAEVHQMLERIEEEEGVFG